MCTAQAYHQVMIKAVVFDLGGVLASPSALLPTLAARIGSSTDQLEAQYWEDRGAYDAGASAAHYWAPICAAGDRNGDPETYEKLAELDASMWAELRPSAWRLLRDCHAADVIVAVLSNSPHAMQTAADRAPWRELVDGLFISATMGLVKPAPEIYATVAEELNLSGPQIAFIDDKQRNVEGAVAAGWHAHLWLSDADTRRWLEDAGVLRPHNGRDDAG